MPGQNLKLNPASGDYIVVDGRPVEDNSLNTPCYIRLKASRTKWLYAPDSKWGSDFYLFHRRHLVQDEKTLLTVAERALQPLIDNGRASKVVVTKEDANRNAFECKAVVTQQNGQATPLTFSPITN